MNEIDWTSLNGLSPFEFESRACRSAITLLLARLFTRLLRDKHAVQTQRDSCPSNAQPNFDVKPCVRFGIEFNSYVERTNKSPPLRFAMRGWRKRHTRANTIQVHLSLYIDIAIAPICSSGHLDSGLNLAVKLAVGFVEKRSMWYISFASTRLGLWDQAATGRETQRCYEPKNWLDVTARLKAP
jgi:hypothetical protein